MNKKMIDAEAFDNFIAWRPLPKLPTGEKNNE